MKRTVRLANALLVWTAVAAALAGTPAAAQTASLEYAVKANYLYKFAPFVEWPPAAFASAAQPLVVCVVGHDPFGRTLDEAVTGQRLGERSVTVRRMASVDRMSGCHIAYISDAAEQTVEGAVAALHGTPVLTVTDGAHPGVHSVVQFVIQNNRVRFDIDEGAAAENGLTVSSKLLSLAQNVRPKP